MSRTYVHKPALVKRNWYLLDASEATLGRVATVAARLLIGKDKPTLTPHVDDGDFVVIINSSMLKITGAKTDKKIYYRHSGYPGGLKQKTMAEAMAQNPEKVIRTAVRGMLPVNKLRDGRLRRLKVFGSSEHSHQGQAPVAVSLNKGSK